MNNRWVIFTVALVLILVIFYLTQNYFIFSNYIYLNSDEHRLSKKQLNILCKKHSIYDIFNFKEEIKNLKDEQFYIVSLNDWDANSGIFLKNKDTNLYKIVKKNILYKISPKEELDILPLSSKSIGKIILIKSKFCCI